MPRPLVDSDGRIVPESEVRRLWVIRYGPTYVGRSYTWVTNVSEAAAWNYHEKELAEDVAANIVLHYPGYLGKIEVIEVRG